MAINDNHFPYKGLKKTFKVLVIGAGAVGTYYGGKLAQAGAEVSVVARSEYDWIRQQAYRIKSIHGNFDFKPHRVFSSPEQAGNNYDLIQVSLKVLPEINRVQLLKPTVSKNTSILLLQNGIDIEREIAEAFPNNEILSGLAFICVFRTSIGHITHQDYGHLGLARYAEGKDSLSHFSELAQTFEKAGVKVQVSEDVWQARWKKLNWNAPYNPISVLSGGRDTEKLMNDPESLKLITQVMQEVRQLSVAHKHAYPETFIKEQLEATRKMKAYKPSMLLDHEAKRPMEVEAILGNTVQLARRLGVAIPHIETLYALLKQVDLKNKALFSKK